VAVSKRYLLKTIDETYDIRQLLQVNILFQREPYSIYKPISLPTPIHQPSLTTPRLSGLPDGIHPGHAQIPFNQLKSGNKVTIENTDTLIGTCIGLDECVRNLMVWANIPLAAAVQCVTENVADAMNLRDRGRLEVGRRGDFVVLSEEGGVVETWLRGRKVFEK
jgi:hypothetical protein